MTRIAYFHDLVQTTWIRWFIILLLIIVIFFAAEAGRIIGSTGMGLKLSVLWAPTGISLAALLLFGYRIWPAIFLGNLSYNLLHLLLEGQGWVSPALIALVVSAGSLIQALLAAYIIKRFSDPGYFNNVRDIVIFLFPAGILSCMIASTLGVAALYWGGNLQHDNLLTQWMTFWLGDSLGVFIFTPLIVVWSLYKIPQEYKKYWKEALAMLAVFGLINYLTFVKDYPFIYLQIPLCLWIAYRFRMHGASLVIVLVSLTAILPTAFGTGGVVANLRSEPLLILVNFLEVIIGVSLIVAALINERSIAWNRLEEYNKNLEFKVQSKTKQLQNAQEEMFTKEKLASLGVLAFGIGRQIREPLKEIANSLTASQELLTVLINTFLDTRDKIDEPSFTTLKDNFEILVKYLDHLSEQTAKADRIVEAVAAQSMHNKTDKLVVKAINLHIILNDCLATALKEHEKHPHALDIHVEKEYDKNVGMFDAVPEDLTQAFMSILEKSILQLKEKYDLLGKTFQPMLKVRTEAKQNRVEIQFYDNGQGLSPKDIESYFSPFLLGECSGLGLAIAHDILVQEHHGEVIVNSREGEFTKVTLSLPFLRML